MAKCMCVGCDNYPASRLQARLDSTQREMLGYFCKKCILVKCAAKHKGK